MLTSNLKKEKPMEVGHILPNLPPSPFLVLHISSANSEFIASLGDPNEQSGIE